MTHANRAVNVKLHALLAWTALSILAIVSLTSCGTPGAVDIRAYQEPTYQPVYVDPYPVYTRPYYRSNTTIIVRPRHRGGHRWHRR